VGIGVTEKGFFVKLAKLRCIIESALSPVPLQESYQRFLVKYFKKTVAAIAIKTFIGSENMGRNKGAAVKVNYIYKLTGC